MTDELKKNELNEKQLKDVSGGGWGRAKWGYSSGKTPRFSVGQRVKVDHNFFEHTSGVITDIDKDMSGLINEEFTYTVRFDDGKSESNVYESQMLVNVNDNWIPR